VAGAASKRRGIKSSAAANAVRRRRRLNGASSRGGSIGGARTASSRRRRRAANACGIKIGAKQIKQAGRGIGMAAARGVARGVYRGAANGSRGGGGETAKRGGKRRGVGGVAKSACKRGGCGCANRASRSSRRRGGISGSMLARRHQNQRRRVAYRLSQTNVNAYVGAAAGGVICAARRGCVKTNLAAARRQAGGAAAQTAASRNALARPAAHGGVCLPSARRIAARIAMLSRRRCAKQNGACASIRRVSRCALAQRGENMASASASCGAAALHRGGAAKNQRVNAAPWRRAAQRRRRLA